MEIQENLSIAIQIIGFIFVLIILVFQFLHMKKSGAGLMPNETAKLIVMVAFVYAVIKNGSVDPGSPPVFDFNFMMILLGAILGLAGITNWKEIQEKKK